VQHDLRALEQRAFERSVMRARAPSKQRPASERDGQQVEHLGQRMSMPGAARAGHAADDEVGQQECQRAAMMRR
jgi:hypothetical protein